MSNRIHYHHLVNGSSSVVKHTPLVELAFRYLFLQRVARYPCVQTHTDRGRDGRRQQQQQHSGMQKHLQRRIALSMSAGDDGERIESDEDTSEDMDIAENDTDPQRTAFAQDAAMLLHQDVDAINAVLWRMAGGGDSDSDANIITEWSPPACYCPSPHTDVSVTTDTENTHDMDHHPVGQQHTATVLQEFLRLNPSLRVPFRFPPCTLDWKDPLVSLAVTKAELHYHYSLQFVLPLANLCPPVPRSVLYLTWTNAVLEGMYEVCTALRNDFVTWLQHDVLVISHQQDDHDPTQPSQALELQLSPPAYFLLDEIDDDEFQIGTSSQLRPSVDVKTHLPPSPPHHSGIESTESIQYTLPMALKHDLHLHRKEILAILTTTTARVVSHIDIGCGASAIFSLLGAALFGWQSIGTDINYLSLLMAAHNVDINHTDGYECGHRHRSPPEPSYGVSLLSAAQPQPPHCTSCLIMDHQDGTSKETKHNETAASKARHPHITLLYAKDPHSVLLATLPSLTSLPEELQPEGKGKGGEGEGEEDYQRDAMRIWPLFHNNPRDTQHHSNDCSTTATSCRWCDRFLVGRSNSNTEASAGQNPRQGDDHHHQQHFHKYAHLHGVIQNSPLHAVMNRRYKQQEQDEEQEEDQPEQPPQYYDITTCNPPFFRDLRETNKNTKRTCVATMAELVYQYSSASSAFTPTMTTPTNTSETISPQLHTWFPSGEIGFLTHKIVESAQLPLTIRLFTTMYGSKSSIPVITGLLSQYSLAYAQYDTSTRQAHSSPAAGGAAPPPPACLVALALLSLPLHAAPLVVAMMRKITLNPTIALISPSSSPSGSQHDDHPIRLQCLVDQMQDIITHGVVRFSFPHSVLSSSPAATATAAAHVVDENDDHTHHHIDHSTAARPAKRQRLLGVDHHHQQLPQPLLPSTSSNTNTNSIITYPIAVSAAMRKRFNTIKTLLHSQHTINTDTGGLSDTPPLNTTTLDTTYIHYLVSRIERLPWLTYPVVLQYEYLCGSSVTRWAQAWSWHPEIAIAYAASHGMPASYTALYE